MVGHLEFDFLRPIKFHHQTQQNHFPSNKDHVGLESTFSLLHTYILNWIFFLFFFFLNDWIDLIAM